MSLVDRESGEILEDAVLDRAEEFVLLSDEATEVAATLADIRKRLDRIRSELLEVMPEGGVIDAVSGKVIRIRGNRARQVVNRPEAERWSEQLEDLGLGSRRFVPAGIALFRDNQARIRAAGLPYDALVPEPPEPGDTLAIEPK